MSKGFMPVLFSAVVLTFAGCVSLEYTLPEGQKTFVLSSQDLTIKLTYIPRSELIERHGHNDARRYYNPYVDFPALITPKRFIVFDIEAITSVSTVNFDLDNIFLRLKTKEGDAKSHQYLMRIWSHYNRGGSRTMDRTLSKTILEKKFMVEPDKPVEGYLVFAENYPKEGGEGEITFYLSTPGGDTGTLELPIVLGGSGADEENYNTNTGIFAGSGKSTETDSSVFDSAAESQ